MRWPAWNPARRALSGGVAALVVAPVLVVLGQADGIPATRVEMSGGGAWLASPTQGVVTLIDGPSEQVVALRSAPGSGPGADLATVQAGSSAYLVDRTRGTVARVDGASYETSPAYRLGAGGGAPLEVYTGPETAYAVDGRRRTAALLDPETLRVRETVSLAAQPGRGQSLVDDASRLWVVDGGGLAWFDRDGKHVRAGVPGTARLVAVRGRPFLVDLERAGVGELDDDGEVRNWSCLDVRAGDDPQLLGSTALGRVLAAVPATGMLVTAGDGGDDCGRVVRVGEPGDRLGPVVEAGGFAFVPNGTSGRTVVVDLAARRVVADPPLVEPGNRLELVAKDGLVFYNDLDSDRAGVIRFDGREWRAGTALRKYALTGGRAVGLPGTGRAPGPGTGPGRPAGPEPGTGPIPGTGPTPGRTPGTGPADPGDRPEPPPATDGPPVPVPPDPPPNPPGPNPPGPNPPGPNPPGPNLPGPNPPGPNPPEPGSAVLTVQVAGAGRVSVQQPAATGRTCQPDTTCRWEFTAGTAVVLQVPTAPTPDVRLDRVTGCTSTGQAAGNTVCTVRLRSAATVRAVFVPVAPREVTLDLTITGAGGLRVVVDGGSGPDCQGSCSVTVEPGTPLLLIQYPSTGHYLADWDVPGCVPTGKQPCELTLDADLAATVVFAPEPTLTVTLAGGGGTVTAAGETLCTGPAGRTCTRSYPVGTQLALSATPAAGDVFGSWSGCASVQGSTCQVTLTGAASVTAAFARAPDTTPPAVTLSGGGQSVGPGSGIRTVEVNGPGAVTVTASATDDGSAVTGVQIWNSYSWTCTTTDGDLAQNRTADAGAPTATGTTTASFTLTPSALARCGGSFPVLSGASFTLSARATSAGGEAETDTLRVVHRP